MKTFLKRLSVVAVLCVAVVSCNKYDDSELRERLDALEETVNSSVKKQIDAINSSITAFESVHETLTSTVEKLKEEIATNSSTIEKLNEKAETNASSIEKLKNETSALITSIEELSGYTESLDGKISDLQSYVDTAWTNTERWVEKTFCTLEMYQELVQISSQLKDYVIESDSVLNAKIDSSFNSVQKWVETALKSYYTSTEIDQKLEDLKKELDALNSRLTELENKYDKLIEELSRKLDIVFSDNDVSCSPGDIVSIDYTIINGGNSAKVYVLGENGWTANVETATDSTGTIIVNEPSPIVDGIVLVFVTDGQEKTITRSLNFTKGSMTISSDALLADCEGDTLSIDITTDLQYTVSIPESATWIHKTSLETRSPMRNERLVLTVDESTSTVSRSTIIDLKNASGNILKSITVRQSAATIQPNEIWYKSIDGKIVTPTNFSFGANIVSNTYGKKGVLTFDAPISRICYRAYYNNDNLSEISIPEGVVSIDNESFHSCSYLKSVYMPNSVTFIGNAAFSGCSYLKSVYMPNSVKSLGINVFAYCLELSSVSFSDSIAAIGANAFRDCYKLKINSLPKALKTIGNEAFQGCSSIDSISFPPCLESIGDYAFYDCSSLSTVSFSPCLESIGDYAFQDCSSLLTVYFPNSLKDIGSGAFTHTKLTELVLPDSLHEIPATCFSDCKSLKSIVLPYHLKTLDNSSFSGCTSLQTVVIPKSVNSISNSVFANCTSLKEIHLEGYPYQISKDVFSNLYLNEMSLFVPSGFKTLYESYPVWQNFGTITEVDSITMPAYEAVDLGLSVKWATTNVFANCPENSGNYYAWGETLPKSVF